MRIRVQLFLGIAALMLAMTGIQWWLQTRQLQALELELGKVATSVGRVLIHETLDREQGSTIRREEVHFLGARGEDVHKVVREDVHEGKPAETAVDKATLEDEASAEKAAAPGGPPPQKLERVIIFKNSLEEDGRDKAQPVGPARPFRTTLPGPESDDAGKRPPRDGERGDPVFRRLARSPDEIRLDVEADEARARVLVVRGMPGGTRRIPIPVEPSVEIVQATRRQSLAASGLLLVAGLLAAALFAHRVSQPLRRLAGGVEAVGRGELGTQLPVTGRGEIGELQAAFNRMSTRLRELEAERERWRAREHLAELGELARGLGHTLRNPLNTLGLVVEELSSRVEGGQDLVTTARGQIRRIDSWLRSFLAVGAGQSVEPATVDLGGVVQDVALEAVQQGVEVQLACPEARIEVRGVEPALRSALANLIGNAVEASPPGASVQVGLEREGSEAVIRVVDRGPGLPLEVRERLFSPHVTTKTGGSGMGLFLARQLVEGGHGGSLEIEDAPDGGTVATVRLPLIDAALGNS